MKETDVESSNLFTNIPANLSEELFTLMAEGENVRVERIVSKGHSSPASGWYDQPDNEWVVVLRGEAKISFESGKTVHLKAGDYLDIPAHTKHAVVWTKADLETVWLAIHYL